MQSNSLPGKLIGVRLNGKYYKCQTDAKLTLTASTTTDDACKPDQGVDSDPINWNTKTVDGKDWQITFSAKSFADGLAASNSDLIDFFLNSDLNCEADFMTNPDLGDGVVSTDFVLSGPGLLTGVTLNAPEKGASTYDATIDGNGAMTKTELNRTT